MSFEWTESSVEDLVQINPSYKLKKGTVSKKISMADLDSYTRKISGFEICEFTGGSKFINGDTLLARITPCLENGKTSYVDILGNGEIGFGSTEFIVLKGKEGLSDNKFVYYLAISPEFRSMAIKSMTGTSGRQRAQVDVIGKWKFKFPPVQEQKAISKILSCLDEKIELNNSINKNLEEMAQALFKRWFVDFEFPNENGEPYKSSGGEFEQSEMGLIPKGWGIFDLGDLINVIDNRGKTPPLANGKTAYPIIDVKALSGPSRIINFDNCLKFVNRDTYESWFRNGHPKPGDILLSTVGSLAEMKLFYGDTGCIAQNVVALRSNRISHLYMYQYLKFIKNDLISYNIGSVQPSIKVTHFIKHKVLKPHIDLENKFNSLMDQQSKLIYNNIIQIENLKNIRNTLLPKLMSGEIRAPMKQEFVQTTELSMAAESKEEYSIT
ncbi:restriction endonuclease subunit S [Brevibacillus sp. FIR094]|uniref:restriction endonuclease subunit S n=1 Tax=Brevibacillus sp. FIR094 TaxID=3134809 RepID=UPI003D20944D